ncbi:MAG: hypothetical protein KDK36_11425 [Leptospiraceae bacterium]|nr:hypothetical protein [Leptospiraceae bacterium]
MKNIFYIFLLTFSIIPLLSESIFGKKGRMAFYKMFQSELIANSSNSDTIRLRTLKSSNNSPGTKILEEDFDEQENSDEEQENEELEEDA